jgi:tripartite motif-containing protein 71
MRLFTLFCILVILLAGVQVAAAAETYVYSAQWGKAGGGAGTGIGEFNEPARITFDAADNVFVDDMSNHRIQKFGGAGSFIAMWGSEGVADPPSAPGTFLYPMGVAVDSMDYLYVADRNIHRVQVMDPDQLWAIFGPSGTTELLQPSDVAVDSNDTVYVVDWGHDRIRALDIYGAPLGMWGASGSGNGQFNGPRGIAIDGADNVYVADTGNNRIQKFTVDGTYVAQWGSAGTGTGQFNEPWGVGTDAAGNVYVADKFNNRVQKFDGSGNYLATIGGAGTGNGQLAAPLDVEVNASGTVFVADTGNNRVQLFTLGSDAPPASVTNLVNTSYVPCHIVWTWTDPTDADFANVTVYLDNVPAGAVPKGVETFIAENLTPDTAHTISTKTVDTAGNVNATWVNHTARTAPAPAVLAVPPETALPTDTDCDGLYDDVNGNGRKDFADVVLYFNQTNWIAANEPLVAFDYNANGRIDFADVVWLFNHL